MASCGAAGPGWWGSQVVDVAVVAATVTVLVPFVVAAVVTGQESNVNVGMMRPVSSGVGEPGVRVLRVDRR